MLAGHIISLIEQLNFRKTVILGAGVTPENMIRSNIWTQIPLQGLVSLTSAEIYRDSHTRGRR